MPYENIGGINKNVISIKPVNVRFIRQLCDALDTASAASRCNSLLFAIRISARNTCPEGVVYLLLALSFSRQS